MTQYLDASGLTTLWNKTKDTFSKHGALSNIPVFESARTYNIGDEVRYTDGLFYRFKNVHTGTWSTADVSSFTIYDDVEYNLDKKANKNGYYSTLTAGSAENLVGNSSIPATFYYRTAGGTADIGTGTATITKLIGNTVVWNQLVNSTDSSVEIYSAKKYLFNDGGVYKFITASSSGVISVTDPSENIHYFLNVDPSDNLFDLSRMYGAGNEPTDVSSFISIYPHRYYEYNTGKLVNFNPDGIHTVGFNQWDEQWEIGALNASGSTVVSSTAIRSKNFIPIPKTSSKYYVNCPDASFGYICFYDANYTFLRSYNTPNIELVIPENTVYAKFCTNNTYGIAYKENICLNFAWSGYRNGDYEKHWSDTLPLNIPVITGKQAGSGSLSEIIFPNGLLSSGNVHDELYADKAIKRIGISGLTTYVLSTPIEYKLDNVLGLSYKVDDFGTESVLSDTVSSIDTTNFDGNVRYSLNAVDIIKNLVKNYQSQESMDSFTGLLDEIMDIRITKSFDGTATCYTYDASSGPNSMASVVATLDNVVNQQSRLGEITAVSIESEKEYIRLKYPTILRAHGTPAAANRPINIDDNLPWDGIPVFPGQLYINLDAASQGLYYAKDNVSVSNWVNT